MQVNPLEALVLAYFGLRHEASVPELSGHLSVPPSTIMGIVSRFESEGLVFRRATKSVQRGRPRVLYRMRLPGPVLACTLDGTEIDGALVSSELEEAAAETLSVEHVDDTDHAVDLITGICARLRDAGASRGLAPIGLGLSINAVQTEHRVLVSSVLPWATEDLAARVSSRLGLPVVLAEKALVQAWAAYQRIPEPVPDSAVYLNVSDGVSAHAVIGGKVVAGAASLAGEVGHIIVDRDGPLCGCGQRGCLETLCSGPAIREAVLGGLRIGVSTSLRADGAEHEPPRSLIARLWEAWGHGDTFAVSVMDPVLERLGWAIGLVMNLIDPGCLIMGGYVLRDRKAWVDEIVRRAERWTLKSSSRATNFVTSTLDRGDILRVVASRSFFDPAAWAGRPPAAAEPPR